MLAGLRARAVTSSVYIVENHAVVRQMIAEYVERSGVATMQGQAATAEEALREIALDPPSLVIADLSLPAMSGLELVREITARFPDVRCMILTGHHDASYRRRAFEAGARGFVLKDDPDELFAAIRALLSGGRYGSPEG